MEATKLKDRSHLKLNEWYKRNHFEKNMKDIKKSYEKYGNSIYILDILLLQKLMEEH